MSRVLIMGSSPLLFENADRTYAPGVRTWQLTKPVVDAGHDALLLGLRLPHAYPESAPPETMSDYQGMTYLSMEPEVFNRPGYVQGLADDFDPEAVVYPHATASFHPSIYEPLVPVWIDINGHVMTEAQAKAAVYQDDSYLDYFFWKNLAMLQRGDRFSTVCEAQTNALLGELGMVGRLSSKTNGRPLVHTVPVGVDTQDYPHDTNVIRGVDVDPSHFVVLWSGGYNTWTDVDTMFEGLIYAMERDPSIRFVSTGGQIDGHDEMTYPRLLGHIEGSSFKERFIMKGWLPREMVPSFFHEADLGINCEKDICEVRFGSKQRILDWSRAALPVVTTRLTELSQVIEQKGIGHTVQIGDAEELGKKILAAAEDRQATAELGRHAQAVLRDVFAYERTVADLLEWLERPEPAPDRDRFPTCIEAIVAKLNELESRLEQGAEVKATPERQAEIPEPAAPAEAAEPSPEAAATVAPDGESLLGWLARVVRTSYRQGGALLIFKRALLRLLGRGTNQSPRRSG